LVEETGPKHEALKDVTARAPEGIAQSLAPASQTVTATRPATLPAAIPAPTRRGWIKVALAIVLLGTAAASGGYYWWKQSQDRLPAGIVSSNGRIEADQIDIDTKFAGRLSELRVNEGDMVHAGQAVARMDTRDLEASLKRAEALLLQAQRAVDEARATREQWQTQVALAQQQLDRTSYLFERGNSTQELLDQRRQQLNGATAAFNAATARVGQAEHALTAAEHEVELLTVNIADNTLIAPRDGRIQYRIAQVGEVLPAGGKVLTMIDISSVYMDIYLPTLNAGQARIGTDARIVLDAYPDRPIPAKVSFVATQSQFTPKTVETRTERERLMFRIRVRIDPALLRAHAEAVRTGLPGVAYVRPDPNAKWPAWLQRTVGS
jgi:HlyD family secretion protein